MSGNRKSFVLSALLSIAFVNQALAWSDCGNGTRVNNHLEWSANDTGHNEGADCGLAIVGPLASVIGISLPTVTFGGAGEVWKRNSMTSVAVALFKAGRTQDAVNLMICAQVHQPVNYSCLVDHRDEIQLWLQSR